MNRQSDSTKVSKFHREDNIPKEMIRELSLKWWKDGNSLRVDTIEKALEIQKRYDRKDGDPEAPVWGAKLVSFLKGMPVYIYIFAFNWFKS